MGLVIKQDHEHAVKIVRAFQVVNLKNHRAVVMLTVHQVQNESTLIESRVNQITVSWVIPDQILLIFLSS